MGRYSYATMKISRAAYEEIKARMVQAEYGDQFIANPSDPDSPRLNMLGIALVPASAPPAPEECDRPPIGWRCTRGRGHEGPCAAVSLRQLPLDFMER